jgi:hypothetical protein
MPESLNQRGRIFSRYERIALTQHRQRRTGNVQFDVLHMIKRRADSAGLSPDLSPQFARRVREADRGAIFTISSGAATESWRKHSMICAAPLRFFSSPISIRSTYCGTRSFHASVLKLGRSWSFCSALVVIDDHGQHSRPDNRAQPTSTKTSSLTTLTG